MCGDAFLRTVSDAMSKYFRSVPVFGGVVRIIEVQKRVVIHSSLSVQHADLTVRVSWVVGPF